MYSTLKMESSVEYNEGSYFYSKRLLFSKKYILFNFFINVYLIIVELNDVLALYFNPFILLNFLHCLSTFQLFDFF